MTPQRQPDDPLDWEEFATQLDRLVARARDDGVHLVGGVNVRSPDPAVPDYTVEITELAKRSPDWTRK